MTSLNAVLMKFFKLPPALRMLLAVAGFGSLASIVFFVLPSLRTRGARIWIVVVVGAGLLVALLIYLLRRAFRRKKSAQLSGALETQGPSRGDVAEQERIYREKFAAKLAELKANGLSVYHLPWFVLLGEPGCGKTASLIHSGLDFPLGKDEVPGFGGTRNYNWWFTNDAVILDTAGRIAFQEEGTTDKLEWEYFLRLLKRRRPRCPLNGVIIAVPADKLLRDSAEERALKAGILRERLRQVHQLLGVRFPTFLLVTKMDLVGGFSEFFEEIRVDLQQRNQMFGWSRPGEFCEPYDPAGFPAAFDQLYYRLRDWGLRYLQRRTTEQELGLIITFPESFRQLRQPLQDYVATIFQKSPLVEPPFFRGFYFTSAVQEGTPIFDVFARSGGGHLVAERPTKAVDSKAFFIHDLYANKVFPEHGLVFRSARHATLNRRMRRLVWAGSATLLVLMLAFFGFGYFGVADLVTGPRQACSAAAEKIAAGDAAFAHLPQNVALAKRLQAHYQAYSAPLAWLYARMLFIGASIAAPRDDVRRIHARFVLECVCDPVLAEVQRRLEAAQLAELMPERRGRYLQALRVFTRWYGELAGQYALEPLTPERAAQRAGQFDALLAFLELPAQDRADATGQFEFALRSLTDQTRSFGRELLRTTLRADAEAWTETICAALGRLTASWLPLTDLRADRTDPNVRYWLDFSQKVGQLRARYQTLLQQRALFLEPEGYQAATQRFLELTRGAQYLGNLDAPPEPGTLSEAYYELVRFLQQTRVPQSAEHRIIRFGDLLPRLRQRWETEFAALEQALARGAPDRTSDPQARVYQALAGGRQRLELSLRTGLATIRQKLGLEPGEEPLERYVNQKLLDMREARPQQPLPVGQEATLRIATGALGVNDRLRQLLLDLRGVVGGGEQEQQELKDLRKWPELLQRLSAAAPSGKALSPWFSAVQSRPGAQTIVASSGLADRPFWKAQQLFALARAMWDGRRQHSVARLLARMAELCDQATRSEELPGMARLVPGFDQPAHQLPFERNRFNAPQAAPQPPEESQQPAEQQPPAGGLRRLAPLARPPQKPGAEQLERGAPTALLYRYHTRAFLLQVLRQYRQVRRALAAHPAGAPALSALERAAGAYLDGYFGRWNEVYSDPTLLLDEGTLELLEQCRDGKLTWPQYVALLRQRGTELGKALADRLSALTRQAVLFDQPLRQGDADDDAVYQLIAQRLERLHRQGASLPHKEASLRNVRYWPRDRSDPVDAFANQLEAAWAGYVGQVLALGPLAGPGAPGAASPPKLAKLKQEIVYGRATRPDCPLIRPLVEIGEFGQRLLVHHLDSKLAGLFAPYNHKYPVVAAREARDDTPGLERLRRLELLEADQFLGLLRQVHAFQARFGKLYESVNPDSAAQQTLRRCQGWVEFLFGPDADDLERADRRPAPLTVRLTVRRAEQGLSAFSLYNQFTIGLPLLRKESLEPALPIRFFPGSLPAADGRGPVARPGQELEFRWSLFPGGRDYGPTVARASDKNRTARAELPASVDTWHLPGRPWDLLLLIGARPDNDLRGQNRWRIPVVIRTDAYPDPYAYEVIVQFPRPFPGTIPPLARPAELPRMEAAGRYLAPAGAGRPGRPRRRPP